MADGAAWLWRTLCLPQRSSQGMGWQPGSGQDIAAWQNAGRPPHPQARPLMRRLRRLARSVREPPPRHLPRSADGRHPPERCRAVSGGRDPRSRARRAGETWCSSALCQDVMWIAGRLLGGADAWASPSARKKEMIGGENRGGKRFALNSASIACLRQH